jgi:hypothetical protein
MDLDHLIERALDPRLQRHETLLRRLQTKGLARRPIDLGDEGGGGRRVVDDAGEPFVVLVFHRRPDFTRGSCHRNVISW